jgi:hypothetical protein
MHSSWKSRGGGGPSGFWQILLRGVLGVVRKSVGGSFLLHFYVEVFQNLSPLQLNNLTKNLC